MIRKYFEAIIFIPILLSLSALSVFAQNNYTSWHGNAMIEISGSHRYKSIFLNKGIYREAKEDLSDIRIVDEKNQIIPYIILRGFNISKTNIERYDSHLIQSYIKKKDAYFDFQIQSKKENTDITGNELEFDLPAEDFFQRIEVYGSYDGERWEFQGNGVIYRVNGLKGSNFSLNSTQKYGYYSIRLIDADRKAGILRLYLIDKDSRQTWSNYQRSTTLAYQVNNKNNITDISIENPNRLQINRITILARGNFKRECVVLDPGNHGFPTDSPYIFNLEFADKTITHTTIGLLEEPCTLRNFKIRIWNYSDRPLTIQSIKVDYNVDKIIFARENDSRRYRLIFGNPNVTKPQYDMELYRESVIKEQQDLLVVKAIQVTTAERSVQNRSNSMRRIFNIVLCIVATLLVLILVKKVNWKS